MNKNQTIPLHLERGHYRGDGEPDPDLFCFNCHKIMVDPQECKDCSKMLCLECANTKADPQSTNHRSCPGSQFKNPHKYVLKQLSEQKFACPDCFQVFELGKLAQEHWKEHSVKQVSPTKKAKGIQELSEENQDLRDDLKMAKTQIEKLKMQNREKDLKLQEQQMGADNQVQSLKNANRDLKDQLIASKKQNSGQAQEMVLSAQLEKKDEQIVELKKELLKAKLIEAAEGI